MARRQAILAAVALTTLAGARATTTHFDVPLLLITSLGGEGMPRTRASGCRAGWSPRQVEFSCGDDPMAGPRATELVAFLKLEAD